jgi:hypothetical protein
VLVIGDRACCVAVAAHNPEARCSVVPEPLCLVLDCFAEHLSEGDATLPRFAFQDCQVVVFGRDGGTPDRHASDASIAFDTPGATVLREPIATLDAGLHPEIYAALAALANC